MLFPKSKLHTWKKFDQYPMETLTKSWFYNNGRIKKQREVSLMKEHRDPYRIAGKCFDLALWLLDEFHKDGITAYPIGYRLHTKHAHVAVIALGDLGVQWLSPILIDCSEDYTEEKLSGFFSFS